MTVSAMSQSYAKSRSSHQDSTRTTQKIWLKAIAGWINQNNKEIPSSPPNPIKTSRTPSETMPWIHCPATQSRTASEQSSLMIRDYHRSSPSHIYDRVAQLITGARCPGRKTLKHCVPRVTRSMDGRRSELFQAAGHVRLYAQNCTLATKRIGCAGSGRETRGRDNQTLLYWGLP